MVEKKSRKRPRTGKGKAEPSGKKRKQKKRSAGDGSVFLILLCFVLGAVGVYFLKDFYSGKAEEQTVTVGVSDSSENEASVPNAVDKSLRPGVRTSTETGNRTAARYPEKPSQPKCRDKMQTAVPEKKPVLCFVIDDVGNNPDDLERFLRVPGKVTFAVLPGLPYSREAAERVTEAGQELLLHQPMEAVSGVYPGPGLLTESMTPDERLRCLDENLLSVPGAVGVNNHMGSKGTSSPELSAWLVQALKQKNLFFLDSRTIAGSRMGESAAAENWKILERNSMFLDNEKDVGSLTAAIEAGKRTAREKGHAVMIGHAVTSELADLMMKYYPALTEEGFVIENLTYLLNESRENNEGTGN